MPQQNVKLPLNLTKFWFLYRLFSAASLLRRSDITAVLCLRPYTLCRLLQFGALCASQWQSLCACYPLCTIFTWQSYYALTAQGQSDRRRAEVELHRQLFALRRRANVVQKYVMTSLQCLLFHEVNFICLEKCRLLSTLCRVLCKFGSWVMFLNGCKLYFFSVRWSCTCVQCSPDTLFSWNMCNISWF